MVSAYYVYNLVYLCRSLLEQQIEVVLIFQLQIIWDGMELFKAFEKTEEASLSTHHVYHIENSVGIETISSFQSCLCIDTSFVNVKYVNTNQIHKKLCSEKIYITSRKI